MLYDRLQVICGGCDDISSRQFANGARFVRKLPDKGALAFLHCFYPPVTQAALMRGETAMARPLPAGVRAFVEEANGARLFDSTICLFGLTDGLTRSAALEDQQAISFVSANECFAASHPDRWAAGWIIVGSVVGWSSQLTLQAHGSGPCSIVRDGRSFLEFASFAAMMESLFHRVGPCFDCDGLIDRTYRDLEMTLGTLFATH